jgi:hypothetical protein
MGGRFEDSNLHYRRFDLRHLDGFAAAILLSIRCLVALGAQGEEVGQPCCIFRLNLCSPSGCCPAAWRLNQNASSWNRGARRRVLSGCASSSVLSRRSWRGCRPRVLFRNSANIWNQARNATLEPSGWISSCTPEPESPSRSDCRR